MGVGIQYVYTYLSKEDSFPDGTRRYAHTNRTPSVVKWSDACNSSKLVKYVARFSLRRRSEVC